MGSLREEESTAKTKRSKGKNPMEDPLKCRPSSGKWGAADTNCWGGQGLSERGEAGVWCHYSRDGHCTCKTGSRSKSPQGGG